MASAQVVERVGENCRRVRTTLGKVGRPPEVERCAIYNDLWQSDGLGDSIVDPQIGRIERCIRREVDADAIESDARLIDEARIEDMGLVERQYLAASMAGIAESRDRISL